MSNPCPRCGTVNQPTARFCKSCGLAFGFIRCQNCGTQNRATDRFCSSCGIALAANVQLLRLRSGRLLSRRYEIRNVLSVGAMGTVYEAVDRNIANKRVAIKEYSPTRITSPAEQKITSEMFVEEAKMLARLNHPNIPKISDYFPEGASQYMVMDFIDGMTLEEYLIQYQRVPEPQVIQWGRQIADALQYLHAQNPPIIFRDMKPGNVILDKHGRIKLIDFGIAKQIMSRAATPPSARFGSPGYAPPEQYSGGTDTRSDVYSLAVTLYALVSGFDPSNDPFNLPPLRSIVPAVSPTLEQAIEIGRQLKVDQRWQTMDQMNHALGALSPAPVYAPILPQAAYPSTSRLPPSRTGALGEKRPTAFQQGVIIVIGIANGITRILRNAFVAGEADKTRESQARSSTSPATESRVEHKPTIQKAESTRNDLGPAGGTKRTTVQAIARIELDEDNLVREGREYAILAGISPKPVEDFTGSQIQVTVPVPPKPLQFDVAIHAGTGLAVLNEWFQSLTYALDAEEPQLVEFLVRVVHTGHHSVSIDFYQERRWLKTIRLEFDSIVENEAQAVAN